MGDDGTEMPRLVMRLVMSLDDAGTSPTPRGILMLLLWVGQGSLGPGRPRRLTAPLMAGPIRLSAVE